MCLKWREHYTGVCIIIARPCFTYLDQVGFTWDIRCIFELSKQNVYTQKYNIDLAYKRTRYIRIFFKAFSR